ncbi:MAG TPA: AbrB/MazE/SpoVT family DNA-binding domain-containing protein [Acidimicrobiales bacterium]|nr:AbrB/MazE/SpoVT family DNA-binding domain-containing protein [Acidimicrobiales bacterium]
MRTTIDAGGRIVVPKKMRDMLGLVAGSEVDIEFDGTGSALRVEPAQKTAQLVEVGGVLVVDTPVTEEPLPEVDLRELLESGRDRNP